MKIDREKLSSLDERTLANMIYEVVCAMGFSKERAKRMAENAPRMRAMLAGASERDLQRIVSMVGEKKASELLSSVAKQDD